MLLVSTKVLDAMAFNTGGTNSWDNSSLRKWMHNSFYNTSFTSREKQVIMQVSHKAGDKDTYPDVDNVFILSNDEIERFMPLQSDRQFSATDYAVSRKVYRGQNGLACWWSRTYFAKGLTYNIWSNGEIDHSDKVTANDGGILPALWIDLDAWMLL